jgi:hypothetical protein
MGNDLKEFSDICIQRCGSMDKPLVNDDIQIQK